MNIIVATANNSSADISGTTSGFAYERSEPCREPNPLLLSSLFCVPGKSGELVSSPGFTIIFIERSIFWPIFTATHNAAIINMMKETVVSDGKQKTVDDVIPFD